MSEFHGRFVWYELMTTDVAAACAFYGAVAGWTAKSAGGPNAHYTILSAGGVETGGTMALSPEARAAGAQPGWCGYIAVDDVDQMAARVAAAGGRVLRAPEDIPGVGRFAVLADLHGAVFSVIKGMMDGPMPPDAGSTPGRFGWRELHAGDGAAAFAFYSGLFGWTKAETFDMGPMGVYQLFASGGGAAVGGMMTKPKEMPMAAWLYYINVDSIAAALVRVTAAGGQVLMGPMQVPGNWIAQCKDPQGVMFAMVGPA